MSKKHSFPFTYPIENDINIHIEHIDKSIYCIWFDNNNHEEQNIPNEFTLYNCSDKIVSPFRNTQSYAVSSNRNYTIKYNENTILRLTITTYLSYPPIIKNEIKVVTNNNDEDKDEDEDKDY